MKLNVSVAGGSTGARHSVQNLQGVKLYFMRDWSQPHRLLNQPCRSRMQASLHPIQPLISWNLRASLRLIQPLILRPSLSRIAFSSVNSGIQFGSQTVATVHWRAKRPKLSRQRGNSGGHCLSSDQRMRKLKGIPRASGWVLRQRRFKSAWLWKRRDRRKRSAGGRKRLRRV